MHKRWRRAGKLRQASLLSADITYKKQPLNTILALCGRDIDLQYVKPRIVAVHRPAEFISDVR